MNVIRRLTTIGAVAAFALGVALPNGALAEAKHKWKMAASWGGGPLMEIGAKAYADKVKFLTDGPPPRRTSLSITSRPLPGPPSARTFPGGRQWLQINARCSRTAP